MAKKPTVPIKVTAHLKDGRLISTDGIIMLDAVLYHAWFYKYAPGVLRGEDEDSYDGYIGLPLRQLPGNRYVASRGIYEELDRHVEHYNKYPDFFRAGKMQHLDMDKGQISSGVGLYRNYRNPVVVRTVKGSKITFWAMGNPEAVSDLLSRIPAVGKKPSMGWGIVDGWTVEEAADDYSLWHPEYGLMRPEPVEKADKRAAQGRYPIMMYGVHPPYWKACNARLCYVPIGGGR